MPQTSLHISPMSFKAKDDIDHYAPELEEKAGYQRALTKLALRLTERGIKRVIRDCSSAKTEWRKDDFTFP
jgi:hypothetical protein